MKKKTGVIIASVCVVILVSVLVATNPLGIGHPSGNSIIPDGNSGANANSEANGNSEPTTNPSDQGEITNPSEENLAEPTFRISPGKFYLDDEHGGAYIAGESAERQLLVTNLNDHAAVFSVDYRVPDHVTEGYSRPISEARDWVWISDRRPEIPAGETMAITIRLGMPSYATPPGDKWEFWIGVIDQSQTGFLVVEIANRWLVTMK